MSVRIIQVRPSRHSRWQKQGGWEVFEADGVSPVYCGDRARRVSAQLRTAARRLRSLRNPSARRRVECCWNSRKRRFAPAGL